MSDDDADRDEIPVGGRKRTLNEFQDSDLGAAGAFVTRWGGDPVRADKLGQQGFFIPPSAFADFKRLGGGPHRPSVVPRVDMPVQTATGEERLEVALLTYEPLFDLDREEWYVDVDLRPIRAAEPFVRFGVVHYQQNALPGCQVSYPVAVTLPLLPKRVAEVAVSDVAQPTLRVKVTGLGMLDILDLNVGAAFTGDDKRQAYVDAFESLRRPVARMFIVHEQTNDAGLTLRTPVDAGDYAGRDMKVRIENDTLVWEADAPLDKAHIRALGRGRLVVYVEEADSRMVASYPNEPIKPSDMFEPKNFGCSGPRFSARIPLDEFQ